MTVSASPSAMKTSLVKTSCKDCACTDVLCAAVSSCVVWGWRSTS